MKTKTMKSSSFRCWWILLALTCCACLSSIVTAQDPGGDLPFDSGSTGVDGAFTLPFNLPPLDGPAMAYDAERGELILFGGLHRQTNLYMNNTWTFDGTEWVEKTPVTMPAGRSQHEMVYDSVNKVIVLFGGYDASGTKLADTWLWDGTDWTLQSPATSPPGRYQFGMAFDAARSQVVVYGGWSVDSSIDNDTWVWDGTDWSELTPVTSPPGGRFHALGYDPVNEEVLLYGGTGTPTQTWTWDGTDWTQRSPTTNPAGRYYHTIEYDPVRAGLILFAGQYSGNQNDTWLWDGSEWTELVLDIKPEVRYNHAAAYEPTLGGILIANGYMPAGTHRTDTWLLGSTATEWQNLTGDEFWFDMRGNSSGIWNYTSITVPAWVTIRFIKNAENTPVFWLATENVVIDGVINVEGEDGITSNEPGDEAQGGPGGFAGGLGGTRYDVASSYAGAPGQGPGGGLPGITASGAGGNGEFNGVYGNASLLPLIGGSGGGGGGSSTTAHGGTGGGGGGAILIASKMNIEVNGTISADGGGYRHIASAAGYGSGGAIRLVSDRVSGTGKLYARNGANSTTSTTTGIVRLEAFYRTIIDDGTLGPIATAGAPSSDPGAILPTNQPTLVVAEVAGQAVPEPPAGSSVNPDVIFQEPGAISVKVIGLNVPDGTPVSLRIVTSGEVINLPGPGNPIITLSGGEATFSVFVPAGLGNIQAFAEYTP